MAINQKTIFYVPLSILVSIFLTILFFVAQPLLVKFSVSMTKKDKGHTVLISQRKAPPPQEFEEDKELEQVQKSEKPKDSSQATKISRPKIDMAMSGLAGEGAIGGTIAISNILKQDFQVSSSLFVTAFNLNEVDQKPSVVRSVPPRYPFEAQQKGIEGRVTVRFVVDSTGQAQEPEIAKVEPPEIAGIFEESALSVIKKYKFKPAVKGGKAVDCIVLLPIKYSVTE